MQMLSQIYQNFGDFFFGDFAFLPSLLMSSHFQCPIMASLIVASDLVSSSFQCPVMVLSLIAAGVISFSVPCNGIVLDCGWCHLVFSAL